MALIIPTSNSEVVRPTTQFPPSVWGNYFVDYVQDEEKLDQWAKRARVLLRKVKEILKHAQGNPEEIYLLDAFYRLGLSYQFEKEINDALHRIHTTYSNDVDAGDLYFEATRFRVLREGGYKVSTGVFRKFMDEHGKFKHNLITDVFEKFKDEQGKTFKKSLTEDVKGLLSLYEAAFLGIRGEDILDEAIAFTSEHLKSSLPNLDPLLAKQVQRALELPTHKRLARVNARYFTSLYEEIDDKTSEDMLTLLEYAKLDFNLLQAVHQREIKDVSKWWKENGLAEKLFYARNRVVECYVWNMSVAPEPHLSRSRVFGAKMLSMMSLTDDTYDAYGVYEELKQYTEAIERWDLVAMDELPDYLKSLYRELITLCKESEEELEREGHSYQIDYSKQALQDLCRAYFTEQEWYHNRYTPGTEEYIRVSLISSGYPAAFLLNMVYMKDASIEAFKWGNSQPRIVMASAEIARFMDDLTSNEFEQQRGHVVSSIECFMKEKGITRQEVKDLFKHFYDTAWKDINQACLRPTPFPMYILSKVVNLARVIDGWYICNDEDKYTSSGGSTKEMITTLLVDPIPV